MAITSKFHARSTANEVVEGLDLRGKAILITGGTGGLGIEAAKALQRAGASVVATARDLPRAQAALAKAGLQDVSLEQLDLTSLASVRALAARWGDRPLDVLINNAGIMNVPEGTTADGFECHIGVNHLAHFLLGVLLTPALKRAGVGRVISVSSSAHRLAPWNEEDPHSRSNYDAHIAYGASKSANALFALAYDNRHSAHGIRAFSLMPGIIETPLMTHVSEAERSALFARMAHVVKTPEQGASTIVWAATAPELDGAGGIYLENCQQAGPSSPDVAGLGVAPHVCDPEAAERLWQWSLQQVELG